MDGSTGNQTPVDLNLWGKSKGLPEPYPLMCHLVDSGAAATVLWRDYVPESLRLAVARGMGTDISTAGRLIAFWTALHDIGKITAGFQSQRPQSARTVAEYGRATGSIRHDHAVHLWLGPALAQLGYPSRSARGLGFRVAQMLGGHHGCFHPLKENEIRRPSRPELGTGAWEEQRRATLEMIQGIFEPPPPPQRMSIDAAAAICGIVILADWIVSQESFLSERLPHVPGNSHPDLLRTHHQHTEKLIPALLETAGLTRLRLRAGTFRDEFPFDPNPLQASVAETLPTLLGTGPALLLVMAPMGEGKTETAFHAARLIGAAAGAPGLFVTLPTMATADQMYQRVHAYAAERAETPAALTLLHSMSWLNNTYVPEPDGTAPLTGEEPGDRLSKLAATDWLRGRKRGLLAPLAVGTVDQALMTVLPVRHNVLRMLGLAGKVLVVDEVHAYDAYMQQLLARLLTWLGRLGTPVVLLSATLPEQVARSLVHAYLAGAGEPAPDGPIPISYPGWVLADPATGQVTSRTVTAAPRSLHIRTVDIPVGADVDTDKTSDQERPSKRADRREALRMLLAPLVTDGGCAMVVCTTVADAQTTFDDLRSWIADPSTIGPAPANAPILKLLHARFPARQREEITKQVMAAFGKDGGKPTSGRPNSDLAPSTDSTEDSFRPPAAILVATQVAEQSLDLDFDLVISDLAPIAQLLQRAGRAQRHRILDPLRPAWAKDRQTLVVLIPRSADGKLSPPPGWTYVYNEALLHRTHDLLQQRASGPVKIPGDIQALIEKVYDSDFHADLTEADWTRLMEDQARVDMANMIAFETPDKIGQLSELTLHELDENMISTRLGAESVRVLCCFEDANGVRWLDREHTRPLPGDSDEPDHLSSADIRTVLGETIPIMAGPWLDRRAAADARPAAWREIPWLRELVVLIHPYDAAGHETPATHGNRAFLLDPTLGLTG